MISFATRRPAVIWALCTAILVAGAIAFTRLPLATRTTVELPRLQVSAFWYGAAPEVIEAYLAAGVAQVIGTNPIFKSVFSSGLAVLAAVTPCSVFSISSLTFR